ncbi:MULTISPECIES: isoaspartyl peptidase/L-asparaginase [unclassified Francisella]|uniref:isoaspartyl peptidase/L-asparaginase n=1 Tax=unclassified Francisella TaxID=2610885 RepID=UPI002E303636|nr:MULTISPECIES: isoaspartyl peptidase/L-asparaginase [unclassified Francisella]MED7818608.1 isoaspartyl peptidase/L-asparaginase [Francisella sp. 19S2-4]MED7829444.1 isoaspartyl peptidase/L-asparaginase [Francisella sp. 19S2-10]
MQKIIIHGGCGAREDKNTSFGDYHQHLLPIIKKSYEYLKQVDDANQAAIFAAKLLEDDEIFNAGTGSRVQQDGQIRMSASIIDSQHKKFAGVINIQNIKNPIEVANRLMQQHHSVLAAEQATTFAHEVMKLPKYNPMTEKRYQEYLELKKGYTGTIGVVALDSKGKICAVTSTGGAGFEYPGRVGDSPTVAGNFANDDMGISCTGIGEHILNQAVAAKIATRVKDGMDLSEAVNKSIAESDELGDYVGLIAIDKKGSICSESTSIAQTLYAYASENEIKTFYDEKIL